MNKKLLTETDIRSKFITPAIIDKGKWDLMTQVREEVYFTKGRVIVRGKTVRRGEAKKADYLLYHKPNLPLAVVEAKDNTHSIAAGLQQALDYAEILDVPFAYSSNGDGFIEHDRTVTTGPVTRELALDEFPSPSELWARYRAAKGYTDAQQAIATQDYYDDDGSRKAPRYYQLVAINRTVDAIARGQNRLLLVMATGTGKTYTAFQIIWRLWKSGAKKRILFLVDRNILADQTKTNDFKPFGQAMTKITNRTVDKSFEIYLCLYQAVTGTEEERNIYKQFSPDFFDLIVVDECHRGSAADDAAWRQVLDYFASATQVGLTATPKETKDVSNIEYFGAPIYTYSLRQGIDDGFLAPYKVVRIGLDKDLDGWRPEDGQRDKHGQLIEDREYNVRDFDRTLVLEKRTTLVAARVTEFLRSTDRFAKTIVFCENIDHAERMRQALVNANPDLAAANARYIMRITGDNDEGKAQLDNFIDPESTYPVIATTSRLMTTGVDAQTCHLIVLDRRIQSMDALTTDKIAQIYQRFSKGRNLSDDFKARFGAKLDEETLNDSHQIVIVAASLDDATERIIKYLNDRDIAINVLFFQVFQHGPDQLLSRAWLIDPGETQVNVATTSTKHAREKEPWNGEFYVSFGDDSSRSWTEARTYGFICAGGGAWYSQTLKLLSPGDLIWVKIPGTGYVGVGRVTESVQSVNDFKVPTPDGERPCIEVLSTADELRKEAADPEKAEHFVRVQWIETVDEAKAFTEIGLFGNQNSVCQPTTPKWRHTTDRLKTYFTNWAKS